MKRRSVPWELSVSSLGGGQERQVLWRSSETSSQPTVNDLSAALPAAITELQLSDIASQIVKHCPTPSVGSLLGFAICCYWRPPNSTLDFSRVQDLSRSATKSVCGRVFKKGDLVWTCRQCSKDPTCVQCDPCFKKSNHTGHEVYFHRSGGSGGCCDCGDSEAWAKSGNCAEHNCQEQGEDFDPSHSLPVALKKGLRAVLKGVVSVIVSYCTAFVRSLEPEERNEFMQVVKSRFPEEKVVACLHNDDIHTFDQVITALRSMNLNDQESAALTQAVDRDGLAALFTDDITSSRVTSAFEKLAQTANLIFSMMPVDLFMLTVNIQASLNWMLSLGEIHDGLRRVISEELSSDLLLSPASYNFSALGKHPVYQRFACSEVFNEQAQFPSEINQLAPIEALHLSLSAKVSVPPVEEPTAEREFKDRVRYPFNYCPKTPMAIMILSSVFLPPMFTNAFQSLIIRFQHDYVFKIVYAQLFTLLYPSLSLLYNRHYGTEDKSIFHSTVQFYTAHSIAQLMSAHSMHKRYLVESNRPLVICNMLISTLYGVLRDLGCVYAAKSKTSYQAEINRFLDHHSVRNKRFAGIPRDFEYLIGDRNFSLNLLAGVSDPGLVDLWLDICKLLQDFNSMKRQLNVHVGFDSNRWQYAADLVLDIEGAITQFLSYALFDDASPSTVASSQRDQDKGLTASLKQSGLLACTKKCMGAILSWINEYATVTMQDTEVSFHDSQLDVTRPLKLTCPQFSVLTDPVSVHISLHRFLSKLVQFAAYGNVDMQAMFSFLREHYSSSQLMNILDYPLRALAFNATVGINMWVRNGQDAANLAYNYSRPPLTKSLRDLDIIAVQISLLIMDPSLVFLMLLKRLELTFLYPNASPPGQNVVNEYRAGLIRGFLKILVHVFGYPPIALSTGEMSGEGVERALARALFHSIFSGSNTANDLERVKHMVGVIETVSDQTFHNVLQTLCDKSSNEGGVKLAIKEDGFVYFDPFYPNTNSKESEALLDRMRDRLAIKVDKDGRYRNSEKFAYNPYCPLLLVEYLPTPHKEFLHLKSILFNPFLINVLHTILAYALQSGTQQYIGSIAYILHIVHMQLHELEQLHEKKYVTGANQKLMSLLPVIRDLCVLWEKEVLKSDLLFQHALGFILVRLMYFSDYKGLLQRHGSLSAEDLETVQTAGFDNAIHSFLESLSIQVGEESDSGSHLAQSKPPAAGKVAASKAMEEAQRRAQQMMQSFADEMSDSDEEDDMGIDGSVRMKKRQEHTCIICKLKSAQPLGYLCFLQPTNAYKHMVLSASKDVLPHSIYRVVSLKGCDVYAEPTVGSNALQHIAYNDHVAVVKLLGQWAQINSPVEGFVAVYVSNTTPNVVNEQNQALTRFCSEVTTVLHPVKEMCFSNHGGARLHVSTCNHAMHFNCWDEYYSANFSQAINQLHGLRTMAYDVSVGECLCPLCKTLVNTLVPINEHSIIDATAPSFHDLHVSVSDFKQFTQEACLEDVLEGQSKVICPESFPLGTFDRRFFDTCVSMRHRLTAVANISEERYLQNALSAEDRAVLSNVGVKCSRVFHSVTSAVATTFVSLSHQYLLSPNDVSAPKDCDKSLCAQLLQLVFRFPRTTMDEQVQSERVLALLTRDLISAIFPRGDRKVPVLVANMDLNYVIASLPYHVVSDSLYPSDTTIFKVLRAHEKSCQNSAPTLWGHLSAPLLTMDLTHMVITYAGMAGDSGSFISFLPIFVLAKVAQMLLDPAITMPTGVSNAPSSPVYSSAEQKESEGKVFKRSKLEHGRSEKHEFVVVLESLRAILAEHAVIAQLHLSADHIAYILDSLVPFIHFLAVVTLALSNFDGESDFEPLLRVATDEMDLNGFLAFSNAFFGKIHAPYNLQQLLQSTLAASLCGIWAESLRLYYRPQQLTRYSSQSNTEDSTSPVPAANAKATHDADNTAVMAENVAPVSDTNADEAGNEGVVYMSEDEEGNEADGFLLEDEEDEDEEFEDVEDEEFEFEDDEDAIRDAIQRAATRLGGEAGILPGLNPATLPPEVRALLEATAGLSVVGSATQGNKWKLLGIYPHNPYVDEVSDAQDIHQLIPLQYHSFAPFVGSFCAAYPSYALNGKEIPLRYPDLSHFNIPLSAIRNAKLIDLPSSYTDLYHMAHYPQGENGVSIEDPAICLLCGTVVGAGNRPKPGREGDSNPGECTLHTMACGAGSCIFFVLHGCKILLMRAGRSCYGPSIYLDENGIADEGRGHSRPMYLSRQRYQALQQMYFQHNVAKEVARKRMTSDTVIRQYWY